MRIVRVSYGYTFNLGNYQSERIDLEAEIDPDRESAVVAKYELQAQVLGMGGRHREAMEARAKGDAARELFEKLRASDGGATKKTLDVCEVCGEVAVLYFGTDYTPLCNKHYTEADRNYEAAARRNDGGE